MSISDPGYSGSASPPYPPAESDDWSSAYAPDDVDEQQGSDSSKDVVKQEASNVAQSASGAAQHVASTTKEQAASVASDAKDQARQLAQQGRQELSQQVSTGKDSAVSGLRAISQELRSMTEGTDESGPATQFVRQAHSATDRIADFVEQREPGQLLDEVRDFARRRPGTFLLGALVAGVVVGRLTRGAVSSARSDSESANGQGSQDNGSSTFSQPVTTPEPLPVYESTPPIADPVLPDALPAQPGAYDQTPPTQPESGYGRTGYGQGL